MSEPDRRSSLESELLRRQIRLYLYGELSLPDRQEVERFREEDPEFRALFAEERAFLLALGGSDIDAEVDSLLEECREDLALAIASEAPPMGRAPLIARFRRRLARLGAALGSRPLSWQPVAATTLVAVGFFAGRGFEPRGQASQESGLPRPVAFDQGRTLTGIETVRLDPVGGQVQIVLEERRVVTGASSDPVIRAMLLDTVQQSHTGARLSSLDALRVYASDEDVRRTLLRSMLEDENPGVRLKALDAVRDHVANPEVREALVQTLRLDPVEGMRVHAIQLLGQQPSRDLVGALQELLEREANPFVLHESERILDSLGASTERF